MNYLGVGLSRTATWSLHAAARILGLRSLHWAPHRLSDVVRGECNNPDFRRYDGYDLVTDLPAAYFYRELGACYPGLKYVLTVRDAEEWYLSVRWHYEERVPRELSGDRLLESRLLQKYVYGSERVTEFLYKKKFNDYNRQVLSDIPREKLLVLDITRGDGWDKLCPFLGLPVPPVPFPHRNRGTHR